MYRISSLIFLVFILLSQCNYKQSEQEVFLFRLGHVANEDHTWHQAALYFAEILEERSNKRIQLEVYPAEQLGKEVELIRGIRAGIGDLTITGGTLQNWVQEAAFTDMPFLLRDTIHLKKVLRGDYGRLIEKTVLRKAGLRVIANFQRGPRHLTTNRPITHPDELNGIIIRVPSVPSYVDAWSGLGAKPTPMAFSEIFTSLQQGTIEAQENPLAIIASANFNEVQDYVNLTSHVISWAIVIIGEKQFQRMPDDLQEIFLEAARDMEAYEHQAFIKKEASTRKLLQEKGMEFIEVDHQAFVQKGSKAVYQGLSEEMKKIYDGINAVQ